MLCESFNKMTLNEKVEFIGKLNHAVQSDERIFNLAKVIIDTSEKLKIFEGVKIIPYGKIQEQDEA